MIYYVCNKSMQEKLGIHGVMSTGAPPMTRHWSQLVYAADFIFTIKDGKPVYLKNRFGDKDYFSEEDTAVMILSAVPM